MNLNTCSCINCRSELPPRNIMRGFERNKTARNKIVIYCPTCNAARIKAEMGRQAVLDRLAREQARAEKWEAICPAEFATIDRAKLPYPALLHRVLAWDYNPRGLLLHGPTGRGKSRVLWALGKREFFAGRDFVALDATTLMRYSSLLMRDGGEADRLVDQLCKCPLILLDDVFKTKLTEAREELLFQVLEFRTSRQLPILVTTNDTGPSLTARFSQDRGEPFVRRLREFCEDVKA